MSLNIPFNYQPDSVAFKTSSYSIPANNYARVTVTNFTTDFTIGGTTVVDQRVFTGSADMTTGTKFTNTSDAILVGHIYTNSTGNFIVGTAILTHKHLYTGASMTTASTANTPVSVTLNPGDALYQSSAAGGSTGYWNLRSINDQGPAVFWVPPSTALNGSGYQVELFTKIT